VKHLISSLTIFAVAAGASRLGLYSQMPDTLIRGTPAQAGFAPDLSARLDSIVEAAIADGATPGAAVAVGRHGRLVHLRGYGRLDWDQNSAAVDSASLYDLASLTKVVATTTAAMILEQEGRLDLDRTVQSYVPEFNAPDKARITVRMLLTHSGGLEAFAQLFLRFRGREQYLEQINLRPLRSEPGTRSVYSDWDLILTQLVIERITGVTLDRFVADRVFTPLGMRDTGFNPDAALLARIAPTERDTARVKTTTGCSTSCNLVHGMVHDENAWAMGGVAGHAGLFSSARDLSVFAQFMLNGGGYGGVRLIQPVSIARWTARQSASSSRALGWDTPSDSSSAGRFFSPRSFGHTGFTGTSMWIDPERGVFVILLTNRVNPTRANTKYVKLRRAVADAVQQAITDAPLIDWEKLRFDTTFIRREGSH
jgi:CubicO group peptidase (beta-lactamase class C family)